MGVDDVNLTTDSANGIVAFQCSHSTALNQEHGLQVHPRHAESPPPARCRLQCLKVSFSFSVLAFLEA